MNIICGDAETYYDNDFTLSKLTTEAYIRDPRFEVHGWGILGQLDYAGERIGTTWYTHEQFRDEVVPAIDWSQTAFLAHHAQFDLFILSHVYGIKPAFIYDTLSMARMLIGNHLSASLESLAQHFGLGAKTVPYDLFRGKHWDEIDPNTQRLVADGCCQDVALTRDLFCTLAKSFPAEEYGLVDATVRMFSEPVLVGNTNLLAQIWKDESVAKAKLLEELGVDGKALRSNEKFAELLRAEGVEPEHKPGKNGPIYAFAQTDDFMRDLLDDDDDRVATLAEARLSEKSNGVQTRTERLGYMSTRGAMCVYLNYAGTHLGGWSGGDKVNWQNFKRNGPIAKAIEAPPGHMIVLADASQIECRLLNMIAGQHDVIERFRNREDPYIALASEFYGETIYKPKRGDPRYDEMEAKRGTGKQGELSCGYGAGDLTIQRTAKKGTYGPPVHMELAEAGRLKDTFRSTHPAICAPNSGYWAQAGRVISRLAGGAPMDWGPLHIADHRIWLPNGTALIYDTLEHHTDEESQEKYWRVRTRKHGWTKIYGAKLVENCLAADTKVLTVYGWTSIVDLRPKDLVFDGVDWVQHGGVIERGENITGALDGVWMTEDHWVKTGDGWSRAALAKGLQRPDVRLPDGFTRRGVDWSEALVEGQMCLWERDRTGQLNPGEEGFLRVSETRQLTEAQNAWLKQTSSLRSVQVHDRSLPSTNTPSVEKLWWSRNHGVRTLARKFREFLGRHGTNVQDGPLNRTQEERSRLFEGELRMDDAPHTSAQPSIQPQDQHAVGANHHSRSSQTFGDWCDDPSLPCDQPVPPWKFVRPAKRSEQVYDILNCGPRHQFVVLGDSGPFIVHNCIQALRNVHIKRVWLNCRAAGINVVSNEHDKLIAVVREHEAQDAFDYMKAEMCRAPDWLPGIPLDSEGYISHTFGKPE